MRIRSLQHSVYQHQYHIVWGTKYRRKFLKEYVRPKFLKSLYSSMKKHPGLELIAVNVDEDHVHLQIEIPPSIPVSTVVKVLKVGSSKLLKRKYKFIRRMYIDGNIWSVGYFSSTIGLNEEQITKYIEYQGKQDVPRQVDFGFS